MHLSVLAEMLDKDLPTALAVMRDHRLAFVDLKQHVYDSRIHQLDGDQRYRLHDDLRRHNVELYCLASTLGHRNVLATPERGFRDELEQGIANLLETVAIVRPRMIRLLACSAISGTGERLLVTDVDRLAPWVFPAYREAISQIASHGVTVTIENEPDSLLSSPEEVRTFFARLDGCGDVGFTWDIQNMWQSGVFPSVTVYERMKPVINYVHLKGGRQASTVDSSLRYRCGLETASWPVVDLVRRVIADDISPVVCLNTSHGELPDDDPFGDVAADVPRSRVEALRDLAYVRHHFEEFS